jgi:hypothetical protein
MPKTDKDPLGPGFAWRLRNELDRVQPLYSSPRYLSPSAVVRVAAWRLAPVVLAVALTGILGLTAWAATGSTNPAVWTERVVTVIHPALPSPTSEPAATPSEAMPPAAPRPPATALPAQQPEPSGEPGDESQRSGGSPAASPSRSNSPGDDHSGSDWSGGGTPSPDPIDA